MIKIGLCTIAFRESPLEDVLAMAGEIGFDGVEIWGKADHMPLPYDAARVKRVREAAAAAGVEIGVFGAYVYPLSDEFETASGQCLDIAHGLGAPVVRIWAPRGEPGSLAPEDYRRAAAQLKDFAARAADHGLVLAIETHDRYLAETSAGLLELLADVAAANLKVNWQPSWKDDPDDPYVSLENLLDRIVNVHAQNFTGDYQHRAYIAEGDVDYGRVIRRLKESGFDGYVEIEFVNGDDPVAWLKKDFAHLKKLVADA